MIFREAEALVIQGETLDEMHLRGFVGADFDGRSWTPLALSVYYEENAGMMDWLSENGFQIPYQFGRFALGSGNASRRMNYSVENKSAYRKYIYLPYPAINLTAGNGKMAYDWQVASKGLIGAHTYSFDSSDINEADIQEVQRLIVDDAASEEYHQAESVYRAFVHENYLTVEETERNVIEDNFYHGLDMTEATYYQITNQVRLTLQQLNEYKTGNADTYGGTEDFITWFCEGDHELNAAAYATAAVLAYRTAGLPARYVEGYYLTADAAARVKTEAVLTRADAHAWVEVYIDGIGWLPVEVVPGNYYADYTVEDVIASPESTVNVVEDNTDALKAGTADTLSGKEPDKTEQLPVVQRVVYVLSIIILVILILFAIVYLVRIQAGLRIHYFEKKLEQFSGSKKQCRIIYERVWKIFMLCSLKGDKRFPYECSKEFQKKFTEVEEDEYIRFLNLTQKSIFSEEGLNEAEFHTIKSWHA
ncbi:MAG: transglutaminase domain-containing protein [Lachnospiraceae bacterium]|nr:transglutaminase domain-containing protein [Lachnospiraceae bacterium]